VIFHEPFKFKLYKLTEHKSLRTACTFDNFHYQFDQCMPLFNLINVNMNPQQSGRVRQKMKIYENLYFLVTDVCVASKRILWYLNTSSFCWQFVKILILLLLWKGVETFFFRSANKLQVKKCQIDTWQLQISIIARNSFNQEFIFIVVCIVFIFHLFL